MTIDLTSHEHFLKSIDAYERNRKMKDMNRLPPESYLCVGKVKPKLEDCRGCHGITNFCGMYESQNGINPFEVRK